VAATNVGRFHEKPAARRWWLGGPGPRTQVQPESCARTRVLFCVLAVHRAGRSTRTTPSALPPPCDSVLIPRGLTHAIYPATSTVLVLLLSWNSHLILSIAALPNMTRTCIGFDRRGTSPIEDLLTFSLDVL